MDGGLVTDEGPMNTHGFKMFGGSALRAILVAAALTLSGAPALAAKGESLLDTPVYNPETKSYFELIRIGKGYSNRGSSVQEIGWDKARLLALSRVYKGVTGRLAIVPSQSVDAFLRDTFHPIHETWIGLRYWCHIGKLQWVDGTELKGSGYQKWGPFWNVEGGDPNSSNVPRCVDFFPVHYWPVEQGFYWNANGRHKEFYMIFIEYPTGGE